MRRIAGAVALLAVAGAAQASPTGTPQSNAPHGGEGSAFDLPFGHHREKAPATSVALAEGSSTVATPDAPRRHQTQAEWRKAYIARHGHDLQPVVHPGR